MILLTLVTLLISLMCVTKAPVGLLRIKLSENDHTGGQ